MKELCIVFALLVMSAQTSAMEVEFAWTPLESNIRQLERKLRVPDQNYELKEYVRHYWGTIEKETKILNAHYHIPFEEYTGRDFTIDGTGMADTIIINSVTGPPVIFDGGCSVLRIRWNMKSRELISINCNGVA